MVITVRGTSENHNKAAHATATMAAIGAIRKSRKSLILQLCTGVPVEDMLVGKKRKETEIVEDTFVFEDTGVDSVFLRLKTQRMQKEQFDICCVHTMSMENMLDVAAQTLRKELFEAELVQDEQSIEDLLTQAHEIYDDVYIYANGKNPQLCEMLNRHSDLVVACIRQGNKEKIEAVPDNALYLVTNYDPDSIFSKRYIKNLYKVNHISVMPYNVEFKDSYNNGTLVNFIMKNQKINEDDITYPFISAMNAISDMYLENKREEYIEPDPMELLDKMNKEKKELREYDEPDVEIVEKRGFFGKTKKVIVAGENGQNMDDEFASINKKKLLGMKGKNPDEDHEISEDDELLDISDEIENPGTIEPEFEEEISAELANENIEEIEDIEEEHEDISKKPKKKERRGWFGRRKNKKEEQLEPIEENVDDEEIIVPDIDEDESENILTISEDDILESFEEAIPEPPAKKKRGRPRKEKQNTSEDAFKTTDIEDNVEKSQNNTDEEWQCPECGTVNSKKFCLECGHPKPEIKKDWFCPECGNKNPANAKFCLECGTKKP